MPNYYQRAIDCLEGIDEIIKRNKGKFDLPDRAALIRFTSWLRTCLSATIPELEAENKRHRWIPVSERLPEEGKIVLVAGGIAKFINGSWFSGMEEPLYRREIVWEVTHWKPIILPEQALKDTQ